MDKEKIPYKRMTIMVLSIILSLSFSSMRCGRSDEIGDVDMSAGTSSIDRIDDERIIDSIASYEDAEHLPMDMPFAGQEALELVRDIYEDAEFAGTYSVGTGVLLDYYKNQFTRFFEGKVTLYDPEGEESSFGTLYELEDYKKDTDLRYYLFDMDGDGQMELCVEGERGTFVCKYDEIKGEKEDLFWTWWGAVGPGYRILGTRKVAWDHDDGQETFFQLDEDGSIDFSITFEIVHGPEERYLVSIPDLEERIDAGLVPRGVIQQIFYDRSKSAYCLLVTEGQYAGLIKGLHDARAAAEGQTLPFSDIARIQGEIIDGIPHYDDADRVPMDMVFAGQEALELVRDIYEEAGFAGTYQVGDPSVYDDYRERYVPVLKGEVKVYDPEGEESLLMDRYDMDDYRYTANAGFYFFDMDGDGAPELCIEGNGGTFICRYDAGTDSYHTWWEHTNSGFTILGTRKITWSHNGDDEHFFQLDGDGGIESCITFEISYRPERKYLVSIPGFKEREADGQISAEVKGQVFYNRYRKAYCLRVTEGQYRELIKGLHDAKMAAKEERVPLSFFLQE